MFIRDDAMPPNESKLSDGGEKSKELGTDAPRRSLERLVRPAELGVLDDAREDLPPAGE